MLSTGTIDFERWERSPIISWKDTAHMVFAILCNIRHNIMNVYYDYTDCSLFWLCLILNSLNDHDSISFKNQVLYFNQCEWSQIMASLQIWNLKVFEFHSWLVFSKSFFAVPINLDIILLDELQVTIVCFYKLQIWEFCLISLHNWNFFS